MILVTGGAGYIGSHCVLNLLKNGIDVVIFDNLELGHKSTVDKLKWHLFLLNIENAIFEGYWLLFYI